MDPSCESIRNAAVYQNANCLKLAPDKIKIFDVRQGKIGTCAPHCRTHHWATWNTNATTGSWGMWTHPEYLRFYQKCKGLWRDYDLYLVSHCLFILQKSGQLPLFPLQKMTWSHLRGISKDKQHRQKNANQAEQGLCCCWDAKDNTV